MLVAYDTVSMATMDHSSRPQWYAVQTRSRFEKVISAELSLAGIEHYLATYQSVHEWKDRQKLLELPLFPGYIFVHLEDLEAIRRRVLRVHGVVRILGHGSSIEPIPQEQIDSVRRLLAGGKQCQPHPFVKEGSWVRVRRGALAGLEGRLVRIKNSARLVLSIDLLSQSVSTEVEARNIEPVPESRRGTV